MWLYYFRMSWYSLKRTPILSSLMVVAIAVGIASCLTTLSCYQAKSTNPMSHKRDQVFAVQLDSMGANQEFWGGNRIPPILTFNDALEITRSNIPEHTSASFKVGTAIRDFEQALEPTTHQTRLTTRGFFPIFEVPFIYGGPWNEQDDHSATKVIVINEEINQRLFAGENSVGKMVLLDNQPFTVSGVVSSQWRLLPKIYDLNQNELDRSPEIYLPLSVAKENQYSFWGQMYGWKHETINDYQDLLNSEMLWVQVWVEFADQQQRQEYAAFIENYIARQKELGRYERPTKFQFTSTDEWLIIFEVISNEDQILASTSIAFLLVCLLNGVVLLLAKFTEKINENAVRRALGASKTDIFIQHIIESLLIGLIGGAFGLALSQLGLSALGHLYPPYEDIAVVSIFTVIFSLLLAIFSSLASGLIPAWRVSQSQPAFHLKTQ